MSTLQELRDQGATISLHCANWIGDRFCSESWQPGWEQMIQYFGLEFKITEDRRSFLAMFECPACGATPHSLVWGTKTLGAGALSHVHPPPPPEELAAMRLVSERVRAATAAHVAETIAVRRRLAAERKAKKAIEDGRDLIGPPSPWATRKRGRWV